MFGKLRLFMAAVVTGVTLSAAASAEDLIRFPVAVQEEHETFMLWYAVQQGWDKEEGLKIEMPIYPSGVRIIEDYNPDKWVVGMLGALPAMLANIVHETPVIANGNDESYANCILVRADDEIAKVKGWNPEYPEVYGSPESIRGRTFFHMPVSHASYLLVEWLDIFGLTPEDVNMVTMSQPESLKTFREGKGDGMVLWAPEAFQAELEGNVLAADFHKIKKTVPISLIANGDYAKAHPDHIAKFLKVFFRGVDHMKNNSVEQLTKEYLRFYKEFCQDEYSPALAKMDIEQHPVYGLDEQIKLFDSSRGPSKAMHWQRDIANFFVLTGRLRYENSRHLLEASYVTDKYLKLAKELRDKK